MSTATLDLARTVLRTEASAILSLVDRLDERLRSRGGDAVRVPRPRRRDRHGQVGHHLPQDRGDALEHRHRGVLSSSRRSDPRRPRHAARRRRRGHRVAQRRDRRSDPAARVDPPHRRAARSRLPAIRARRSARAADVSLNCGIDGEACPLNLAPTASTTAALALGDALAMAVLVRKGFREEDFAALHPGGPLGRRLMRVEQAMHAGALAPMVAHLHTHARGSFTRCRASAWA